MDYGQLVVKLVGDYSKLKASMQQARLEALRNAEELERIYKLSPSLDTTELKRNVETLGLRSGRSLAKNLQAGLNAQKISLTNVSIDAKSLRRLGVEVGAGLAEGIRQSNSQARKAAGNLAVVVTDETKKKLKIHSPSLVFKEIGQNIVAGLSAGLATGGTLAVGSLINGVISTAKSAVDKAFDFTGEGIQKYANQKAIQAQLSIQLGDQNKALDALKFVRLESDRLGFSLENSQAQFAKLVSNAKGSKLSLEELKEVYTGFNTLGRINQLSNDDLKGVFTGLEQTFSKGRIQAEELRGQIAERLPGALAIVSKALGVTQAQLDKLLVSGQLKPDQVWLLFAREVQKEYGSKLGESLNNSTVGFTKLANTIYGLQTSLGQAIEPAVVTGLTFVIDVIKQLGTAGLFDDLNLGAKNFSDYLKQNPQLAKETADIISNALKNALSYVVTLSSDLLKYLRDNPNAIADAVSAMGKFGQGIGNAVGLAKDLLGIFVRIGETIDGFYTKLSTVFGGTPEQQEQFKKFFQYGPISLIPGFPGGANSGNSNSNSQIGGLVSPIAGVSLEKLINYKPSQGQGFYGIRDGGKRQHSKVDFDSRVGGGEGAMAQAALSGTATMHKLTATSGGLNINTTGADGKPITVVYNHLRIEDLQKLFGGQSQIPVQAGQQLGRITHDALSTGAHLDFGIKVDGKYVEPQAWLKQNLNNQNITGVQSGGVAGLVAGASAIARQQQNQSVNKAQQAIVSGSGNWATTKASYYGDGDGFHGQKTSNGEIFNANAMTAAINERVKREQGLKLGDSVEVLNPANGKTVIVRLNDHGPYEKKGGKFVPHSTRGLDLSAAAARTLGTTAQGVADVQFRKVSPNGSNSAIATTTNTGTATATPPGQTPANIAAILAQEEEKARISRRAAIRQSQDQSRTAIRTANDAYYGSEINPSQDTKNVRAASEKLRQIDDQALALRRQREDARSRITINQNKVSSGSLTEDELADTQLALKLDLKLIQDLENSLKSLALTRKKTSDEYAKFNDRDRHLRVQQSDIRLDQVSNEVLQTKITGLKELQNLNPYAKQLEALPDLEHELALRQQEVKVKQELLALEQAYFKGEIDPIEYTVRTEELKKLNAEELKNIDFKYENAKATENQRQVTLTLNKYLRELADTSADLRLRGQLTDFGIVKGDRISMDRDAALLDNERTYAEELNNLSERARLEQLSIGQFKGERIKLGIRNNLRQKLINAQSDRQIEDRDFNSGSRVSESLQSLLQAQAEQRSGLGMDARPYQKQAAILGQNLDFRNQLRDLQRLKDSGEITADAFSQIHENLTALNTVRLDSINNEFSEWADGIKNIRGEFENVTKSFILGTESIGSAFSKLFSSILDNLASLASKQLSDQLFGAIFGGGRGKTPDFAGGGLLGSLGGLLGSSSGYGFDSLFGLGSFGGDTFGSVLGDLGGGFEIGDMVTGVIPGFSKGGLVGSIATGLAKERSQSGRKPVLIIANEGETILTPQQSHQWQRIKESGQLRNYAHGGEVGMSSGNPRIAIASGSSGDIFSPTFVVNSNGNPNVNPQEFMKLAENQFFSLVKNERRPGGSLSRGELYSR